MPPEFDNWDDLRFFLAVAREGRPSRAAKILGVSYMTVLRRLAALEEKLAAQLFERHHDGYLPTAAGQRLLVAVEHIEESLEAVPSSDCLVEKLSPSILIASRDALAAMLAIDFAACRLAAGGDETPEIIVQAPSVEGESEGADIVFSSLNREDRPRASSTLCRVGFAFYAAPPIAKRARGRTRREKLSGAPLLLGTRELDHLPAMRWIEASLTGAKVAARSGTFEGLHRLAAAGLGIAALPCLLGDRGDDLSRLVAPFPEIAATVGAVANRARAGDVAAWVNERSAALKGR